MIQASSKPMNASSRINVPVTSSVFKLQHKVSVKKTETMLFMDKYTLWTKIIWIILVYEPVSIYFRYLACDITYDVDYDVDYWLLKCLHNK